MWMWSPLIILAAIGLSHVVSNEDYGYPDCGCYQCESPDVEHYTTCIEASRLNKIIDRQVEEYDSLVEDLHVAVSHNHALVVSLGCIGWIAFEIIIEHVAMLLLAYQYIGVRYRKFICILTPITTFVMLIYERYAPLSWFDAERLIHLRRQYRLSHALSHRRSQAVYLDLSLRNDLSNLGIQFENLGVHTEQGLPRRNDLSTFGIQSEPMESSIAFEGTSLTTTKLSECKTSSYGSI